MFFLPSFFLHFRYSSTFFFFVISTFAFLHFICISALWRLAACFMLTAANAYMALLSRRAQEVPQATAPECASMLQAVTTARN